MSTITIRVFLFSLIGVTLGGCASTMAPHYVQPAAPIPEQWPDSAAVTADGASNTPWKKLFADTRLRQVVQLALDNNRDLRVATLNIEKARAEYGIQRSALLPDVSADGYGNSGRTPASVSTSGTAISSRAYSLNLGTTAYELDLFGRIRNLKDQALQQYLATEEAQHSVRIGLIAEVANAYMSLAADTEQLTLTRNTLINRQNAYAMQRQLLDVGNASELELKQAEGEMEAAKDRTLVMERTVSTDLNALELLVGSKLPVNLLPDASLEEMLAVEDIPAGLPSDLLQRRPDILASEHALIAAHANIGAARAAFFPRITLTGSIGRASNSLSDLFDSGNNAWSFLPQISIPIFNGGRLNANLKVAKVEREIAVANYERSIQAAFREVADALAVRAKIEDRLTAQQKQVEAAQAAYELVEQRYDYGTSSYFEVLIAQQTLYAAEQNLIATRLARQTNVVALYKALGGDWSSDSGLSNTAISEQKPQHRSGAKQST